MSQLMADTMNGQANQPGDTTTAIAAQINGAENTTTQAAGATEAGTGAIAQAMDTVQNMITTLSTQIKGRTRGVTTAAALTSQAANPMEPSIPVLTLGVATTPQPSMY